MRNVVLASKVLTKKNGDSDIADRLGQVEWDFNLAPSGRGSIHSFHSYPARFIPEIPRTFLRELSPPKDALIFDPFCGSGTTLVEAQQAGYSSVGVDLNPIGCLISRIKTSPLPGGFLDEARLCVMKAKEIGRLPHPDIPNLLHWFRLDVCEALASLRVAIRSVADTNVRQTLEGVFSSIIVRVSNQDSDTRYAAVVKSFVGEQVFDEFMRGAQALATTLASTLPFLEESSAKVINRSIFDVEPSEIPGEVGLVVTSPPYPNAYEYWLYHKYRMWWLGYDPLAVKSDEIGARAHFFSGRRREKEDFESQMSKVFALLHKVMREGTHCCFVVGDSKIHGLIVDNAQLLLNAATENKFKVVFRSDRLINPHRKSFNLHHARIKREHVLVWER